VALAMALFFWLVALVPAAILIGRVWWLPQLVSAHGAAIDDQFKLTLAVAGGTYVLAQLGLGYLIWRYRARGSERATYWHESPKLEATWTIVTAIVFISLAVQGNRIWAAYISWEPPANTLTVEVTAQQFAWNVRYAGPDGRFGRTNPVLINDAAGSFLGIDPKDPAGSDDITLQNIVAVPVDRPVRVMLRTKDVTHSFFVPQLRVKQDAVPGMVISVHFTAVQTGEYEIACAELCGMQHYKMRGRLLVMQESEFENWLKARAAQ
jgi:cytochrome c oxidase subunit II